MAGSIFLAIFLYFFKFSDQNSKKTDDSYLVKISTLQEQLKDIWLLGEESFAGKVKCVALEGEKRAFDSNFLKCNPVYLNCVLSKGNLFKDLPFKTLINENKEYISYNYKNTPLVSFRVTTNQKVFSIELKDKCNEVKLPKNIYAAGMQGINNYVWDNYLQNLSLDKHYVSNLDVNIWIKNHKNQESVKSFLIKDKSLLAAPSMHLPLYYRKLYCQEHGKTLLRSRVFDAAVFYPVKVRNGYVYRAPYPWSKSKKTFLSSTNPEFELTEAHCQNAMIKGCKEGQFFTESSPSWIGIFSSLGDQMESFDNLFLSKANLKVSSKNLERESFWHQNGVRAHWDGINLSKRDFDFNEQYSKKTNESVINNYEVAFRCMRLN